MLFESTNTDINPYLTLPFMIYASLEWPGYKATFMLPPAHQHDLIVD